MFRTNSTMVGPKDGVARGEGEAKQATLVLTESGRNVHLALIPGGTVQDIRRVANLPNEYVISAGKGELAFGDEENLYQQVQDGATLYAAMPAREGS
jgi:hypothetical protein